MNPSSGESAPEAIMSRSESSREVSWTTLSVGEVVRRVARPVDEHAAVGLDQMIRGDGAHAVTVAGTRPSSSSFAMTTCADSSGVLPSVSTTISGLSGSSYGSSTPVKPLISPASALA